MFVRYQRLYAEQTKLVAMLQDNVAAYKQRLGSDLTLADERIRRLSDTVDELTAANDVLRVQATTAACTIAPDRLVMEQRLAQATKSVRGGGAV